jgi:tetratricopeptide (TPR) repeat protein
MVRTIASVVCVLALTACGDPETPLVRGDRLWADSNHVAALAEYRLSYSRRSDDEVLARIAHAYAVTGQFQRAKESYEALLDRSPAHADQAIFDYLAMARRAQERNDRYGMAGALEAASELRAGLPVDDMAAPLARYYTRAGDGDRARQFFDRALAYAPPDSVPALLFEYAQLQIAQGDCGEAMELFNAYRTREPRGERADQARWNTGNCAFQLARQSQAAGNPGGALSYLQVVLDLGVPQNLMDQAWFERGEALLQLGEREQALDAYIRTLEHVRTAGTPLAERARQRIDELRFGRQLVP